MVNKKSVSQLNRISEDTLPKLLVRNCNQMGVKSVALRKKEQSVWNEHSWQDCCDKVKFIFNGMVNLGLNAGDKVTVIGDNSPEWFQCQLAVQACGGIVVGVNPVRTSEQTKQIMERSQTKFAFTQDQEQVDKLLAIKDQLPSLKNIIYWNDKGLNHYTEQYLVSFNALIKQGEESSYHPRINFEDRLNQCDGNDVAMILCVWKSADTVELLSVTHNLIISSGETVLSSNPVGSKQEYVCVMNPGWFFEQVLGFGISLLTGRRLNFAESGETAEEDLREISPHSLAYPSQMWDQLSISIQSNMASSARMKRMLFNRGLAIGCKATDSVLNGRRVKPNILIMRFLSEYSVFRPLRDKHGLDNTKVAYAAGGIVAPETLRFFHAIGVNLKQIFASIEDGVVFNDPGDARIEQ